MHQGPEGAGHCDRNADEHANQYLDRYSYRNRSAHQHSDAYLHGHVDNHAYADKYGDPGPQRYKPADPNGHVLPAADPAAVPISHANLLLSVSVAVSRAARDTRARSLRRRFRVV
jgi:hypothetical protein